MKLITALLSLAALTAPAFADEKLWVTYEGNNGPGKGKHIVFLAGDEEYRSEEALPQLAKILNQRHGVKSFLGNLSTFPLVPKRLLRNARVLEAPLPGVGHE